MLTLLLTFIVWFLLNTVIQSDLKNPVTLKVVDKTNGVRYTKRVRKYTQEHIQSINLLELLP